MANKNASGMYELDEAEYSFFQKCVARRERENEYNRQYATRLKERMAKLKEFESQNA